MFEVKKSREGDLVNNNLRYLLKENKLTMSDLAKELNVTSQQISRYVLGDSGMGVENLAKICKILNCTPQQIYPMLDISGKTQLIQSTEEKSMKTTNTITIENYGFGYYIINFFKNITVVDFLTLNKKAILMLIVLVSVAGILNYLNFLFDWMKFNDPVQNIVFSLALGNTISSLCFGLIIPLIVRSLFSYIILWFGFLNLLGLIEAFTGDFAIISTSLSRTIMWILSFLGCIVYAILVSSLRKKYLKDNGKD